MLITDASAEVFDFSVQFEGQTEALLTVTAASASSLVNGSTSTLLFLDANPAKPSPAYKKFQVMYDALQCNFNKAW
jgi:hypothetical protein